MAIKENSIEEDITRVKQRIEDVKEYIEYGLPYSEYLDLENSFDNILSAYKRVLKENKELKKFITEGITIEPNSPYKNYQLDFLRKNFIPVQKVKDKIEEEKLPLVIVGGRRNKKTLEYGIKLGRRYVLQELLERRK